MSDHPVPDPSHDWLDPDKQQTRCRRCGAYKHLSSGFFPCKLISGLAKKSEDADSPFFVNTPPEV